MLSIERVSNRLKDEYVDKIPNLNIIMAFAAEYIDGPYCKYTKDFRYLVASTFAEAHALKYCTSTLSQYEYSTLQSARSPPVMGDSDVRAGDCKEKYNWFSNNFSKVIKIQCVYHINPSVFDKKHGL